LHPYDTLGLHISLLHGCKMTNYNFSQLGFRGVRNTLPDWITGRFPELGIIGIYPSLSLVNTSIVHVQRSGEGTFDVLGNGGIVRVQQGFNAGNKQAYYPSFMHLLVSVGLLTDKSPYQGTKGIVPKLGGIEVTYWRCFRYGEVTIWIPKQVWLESCTQLIDLTSYYEMQFSMWSDIGFLPLVVNPLASLPLPTSDCFITIHTETPITISLTLLESIGLAPVLDT